MLLLDAIVAPTMRTLSVQVTISSSFLKMLIAKESFVHPHQEAA